jgi:uncharacterized membrane protein YphA (DoxX/SURF4 family)
MMKSTNNEQVALFLLRLGLGVFLLLWALDKFFSPGSTVKIFEFFYKMPITINMAFVIGGLEIILSVAILIGFLKSYSYGLGVIVHGISTLSTWPQLIDPFGKNHLFIAGIPVLFAFIALYLMRKKDTLWSITLQRR